MRTSLVSCGSHHLHRVLHVFVDTIRGFGTDDGVKKLCSSASCERRSNLERVQPFDVVRTRMQSEAFSGRFHNTPATFKAIVSETGVRGLWRGTTATVTRLALGAGAHFFFLDVYRPRFETVRADGSRSLSATGSLITGAFRNVHVILLRHPCML